MHHKSLIAIINFFNIILYSIIAMTLNFLLNDIKQMNFLDSNTYVQLCGNSWQSFEYI